LEVGGSLVVAKEDVVLADASCVRRWLIDSTAGFVAEYYPQYSVVGAWIYFAGVRPGVRAELWRVRADGSGAERVGAAGDGYNGDFQPSPSPDRTRAGFARTANCCYQLLVEVLHLGTWAIDTLPRPHGTPLAGICRRTS